MVIVAKFIRRLRLLPGDPCLTTEVGIDTFFLHNILFLLVLAFFKHKLIAFLCEHVHVFLSKYQGNRIDF